jgi:hypothetical protein
MERPEEAPKVTRRTHSSRNADPSCSAWEASASAKYCREVWPGLRPGLHRDYVLGANEGEPLLHFRDHGNIFINVGPVTRSDNLDLGTQKVTVGAGIPVH